MLMHKALLDELKLLVVIDASLASRRSSSQARAKSAKKRQNHRLDTEREVVAVKVSLRAYLLSYGLFGLFFGNYSRESEAATIS